LIPAVAILGQSDLCPAVQCAAWQALEQYPTAKHEAQDAFAALEPQEAHVLGARDAGGASSGSSTVTGSLQVIVPVSARGTYTTKVSRIMTEGYEALAADHAPNDAFSARLVLCVSDRTHRRKTPADHTHRGRGRQEPW
jgi:hypothetical protein